jgi:hypothetical protein
MKRNKLANVGKTPISANFIVSQSPQLQPNHS